MENQVQDEKTSGWKGYVIDAVLVGMVLASVMGLIYITLHHSTQ